MYFLSSKRGLCRADAGLRARFGLETLPARRAPLRHARDIARWLAEGGNDDT